MAHIYSAIKYTLLTYFLTYTETANVSFKTIFLDG